jgi:SAM-dependent methyltransferase
LIKDEYNMTLEKKKKIETILYSEPQVIHNTCLCFGNYDHLPKMTSGKGLFALVQNFFKKNGAIYYFLIDLFAPVRVTKKYRILCKRLFKKYDEKSTIINYGSGPQYLFSRQDIINVDLFAFNEVDIATDTVLPFKSESVDFIYNSAVLEHIQEPCVAVNEMLRVLKPGGKILTYAPFIVPTHAAPHDFFRWNENGLKQMFKSFTIVESGIGAGPVSGFLWVFQEFISIIFSFGYKPLKDFILILLMCLLFPLKYLDIIFELFTDANKIASGFYCLAEKPLGI